MNPYMVRLCRWDGSQDVDLMFASRPHIGEVIVHEDVRYQITGIDWEPSGVETIGSRPIYAEFIIASEGVQ